MSPRHVTHILGNRWWSAISAYAIDLATIQHARGLRVDVVGVADTPPVEAARRRNLSCPLSIRPGVGGELTLARMLSRRVDDAGVLHVHTGAGHIAADLVRRQTGVAVVRTRGDVRPPNGAPWGRWLYRGTDAVVLSGEFQRPHFRWLPSEKLHVIHAPVETERFRPFSDSSRAATRRSLNVPTDVPLIGLIARLSPVKGHRVAIDALSRLSSPAHLLLCGEPSQVSVSDVRGWADEFGVADRVHIHGHVDDVPSVVSALDVGLVASTGSEAICRIAGEMMAARTPVVASAVSVLPDMIRDGETGRLVPPHDAARTAAALDDLLADPVRLRSMGAEARHWVIEHISSPAVAEAYDRVYARVAERSEAGA